MTMARRLPQAHVTGLDIGRTMIAYAQASVEGIPTAYFRVPDALEPVPFAAGSFDLIHLRYLQGCMPTTGWSGLLQECTRLLRPGGRVCWNEGEHLGMSTSPAFTQFNHWLTDAFRRNGQCFTPTGTKFGIPVVQERLLRQVGLEPILREAVRAGLRLSWSQGLGEGTVNKIKTRKRLMYGRAGFTLLRLKMLHQKVT
jgi:SAM-dependent methyltransferase